MIKNLKKGVMSMNCKECRENCIGETPCGSCSNSSKYSSESSWDETLMLLCLAGTAWYVEEFLRFLCYGPRG